MRESTFWRSRRSLGRSGEKSSRTTRSNVVGIVRNDPAVICLIGAVFFDQHDEWVIVRRYLSEQCMVSLTAPRDNDAAQLEQPE